MIPPIGAISIILGCLLLVLACSEIISEAQRRRVSAAMYLQHYNDLVDKEIE